MTRVLPFATCNRCNVWSPPARHLQVQQKNVRFELVQHLQDLPAILRLRHDFEVVLQSQQFTRPSRKIG